MRLSLGVQFTLSLPQSVGHGHLLVLTLALLHERELD
jgi:hypothetical protein